MSVGFHLRQVTLFVRIDKPIFTSVPKRHSEQHIPYRI